MSTPMTPEQVASMVDRAEMHASASGHPICRAVSDHVRALAAEVNRVVYRLDKVREERDAAEDERDKLRAELARLQDGIASASDDVVELRAELARANEDIKTWMRSQGMACEQRGAIREPLIEHLSRDEWEDVPLAEWPALIAKDLTRYRAALERIAKEGTLHDLTPTKRLCGADRKPLDEANETWWHEWIKRMDEQVRTIAREALKVPE